MSWTLLIGLTAAIAIAVATLLHRRMELAAIASNLSDIESARARGSHAARLQFPEIDLSQCIGCATCVAACPEEGVLAMVHGQARVVHGSRCVGHGRCAEECPVGAIAITLGDIKDRRDLPVLSDKLEAPGVEGLFLAGELTGYALIRTAVAHGTAVAAEVTRRTQIAPRRAANAVLDLCVVGAGPAGIACSLGAKAGDLSFVTIDQEDIGGTVSRYPRRKLVLTQPVELPLHGKMDQSSYVKEDLVGLWTGLVEEYDLPVRTGVRFDGVSRTNGHFVVQTSAGPIEARHVCLALGRRGTPRKLGVPGEELPKVTYSLIDAQSYQGRRVLVVGGGDSAIEAAMGLAEQAGNEVTLSYRGASFNRIKARNERRLQECLDKRPLRVLYESHVRSIGPDSVLLDVAGSAGPITLPNDDVFVMAGGIPPFKLIEETGVSFDPADRKESAPLTDQDPGLLRALLAALIVTAAATTWVFSNLEYYSMSPAARPDSDWHERLRPANGFGLAFGVGAVTLILANLAYLLRRNPRFRFELGSLQTWMTAHVATGILALVLALLHGEMAPGNTPGGQALAGLAVLVVTGAIGRYLYAFVPRAANGRELALDEARGRLAGLSAEWDKQGGEFGELVRREVEGLVDGSGWKASLPRRLWALVSAQARLRKALGRLRTEGIRRGVPSAQVDELLLLAQRAQRASLMAAHFEDLRALLASWRYLHRWTALLMVLLVVLHIVSALRYGNIGA